MSQTETETGRPGTRAFAGRTKDEPLPKRFAELSGVRVAYSDLGQGEPLLFLHGIPTSSYLWRNVARALVPGHRVIAPDLMGLGDTETPLSHRFDMAAQADKVLELADHLGLGEFTLVCHDQGGAAAQWLAVHHQERIRRFVLTNCVCYDNWPVPLVTGAMKAFRFARLARFGRHLSAGRRWARSPVGMRLGVADPTALSDFAIDEYFKFEAAGPGKFEQFRLFTLAGDCRYTVQAAREFGRLRCPTLVLWAADDRWLSVSWAQRLYEDIAGAKRLEIIPFAGHFFQEEEPELCARAIARFVAEH